MPEGSPAPWAESLASWAPGTVGPCSDSSRSPRSPIRRPTRPTTSGTSSTTCPSSSRLTASRSGSAGFGRPRCQAAEAASGPLLEPFHYMTLYLMDDEDVIPEFFAFGQTAVRRGPILCGPPGAALGTVRDHRTVGGPPGGRVSRRRALPTLQRRLRRGRPARWTPRRWWSSRAWPAAWQFTDASSDRHITVAFVDGDLWQASSSLAGAAGGVQAEWAGPLERVDAFRWDWFATLTPQ